MADKLTKEIKQTRPFTMAEAEACLNILRTSEILQQRINQFLKEFGLSSTQYNVLRILQGAGESGLTCSQIADRMITHDSDITRLLDRMEARDMVVRERSSEDRRVVLTKLAPSAKTLLGQIEKPLAKQLSSTVGRLGPKPIAALIDLLEQFRETL